MTKVGDIIYCLGRYVHLRSESPFFSNTITGETKFSWLIDHGRKVNKKTMEEAGQRGYGNIHWFTAEGKEAWLFANKHAHNIGTAVQAADMATLKKIADIIGYNWKDES